MEKMYLKDNETGPCSRIRYGLMGEEVEVISKRGNVYIVSRGSVRFPVRTENLSETPVAILSKPVAEPAMKSKAIRRR